MVKTAFAVVLSLLISGLREGAMPTFSAIAAIICMQPSDASAIKTGVDRIIGTLAGAMFGLPALLLTGRVPLLASDVGRALLAGVVLLPVMYTTVVLRRTSSTAITSITFLSVLYSTGIQPPLMYASNRTLDTLLGIVVAFVVNGAWLRSRRQSGTLFVTSYDGVLAGPDGRPSPATRVGLARLLERGAAITISTHRTPATLLPRVEGISFELPFIIMSGAAVYHPGKNSFPHYVPMPRELAMDMAKAAASAEIQCYIYTIEHDELHVYGSSPCNSYEERLEPILRARRQQSYVCGAAPPADAQMLCLFLGGPRAVVAAAAERVRTAPGSENVRVVVEDSLYQTENATLEVFSAKTDAGVAVRWLQREEGYTKLVAFGGGHGDLPMLQAADIGYLVDAEGEERAKRLGLRWAGGSGSNTVVKLIRRLYYRKTL